MRILTVLLFASLCSGQALFRAQNVSAGGATYTGPGDIITSNAIAFWGLRAYSTATRGNKLANVCDAGDAHCVDMLSDATTGDAVIPSSNPNCTTSGCTVKTLYDLTGGTACGGGAPVVCDATQATEANRPTLTVNCVNSVHPCLTWTSSTQLLASPITPTQSQPYSATAIGKRTFASAYSELAAVDTAGPVQLGFTDSANTAFIYASLLGTASATDSTFHAVQYMFSGSSSKLSIDGSSSTVNAGTNGFPGGSGFIVGSAGGNSASGVQSVEVGWWSVDESALFSALNSNQHSYWGF